MIVDVRGWLNRVWPKTADAVVREYLVVGQQKKFLADVALRGAVFSACHVPGDPYSSAVAEGRRQLALEIIKLAGEDAGRLFALIERPPTKDAPHA